jgi:hypothetical protein
MFALEHTVRRGSGLLTKSDVLTIDTVKVADAFRVAPVDVAGVVVDAGNGDSARVFVVFRQDEFHIDTIGEATNALRRHTEGGDVDPNDVTVHTDPSLPGEPERDREITADWR